MSDGQEASSVIHKRGEPLNTGPPERLITSVKSEASGANDGSWEGRNPASRWPVLDPGGAPRLDGGVRDR